MLDDPEFRAARPIDQLLIVMAQLRHPVSGCPWDLAQDFRSIAPYTIEEAYEVADAIERDDLPHLKEELGDLLLQVVFHSRLGEEQGQFDFDAVVVTIVDKMIRRHPHIFSETSPIGPDAVNDNWERIKAEERAQKNAAHQPASALADVARALPALARAQKLQSRASRVGFDWGAAEPILDKIAEEIGELGAELADFDIARITDELGDVMFALVNLARHLDIDAEAALRGTNAKFERRFAYIEKVLAARGATPETSTLEEMDSIWNEARQSEKNGPG
jgi:MazG family protein